MKILLYQQNRLCSSPVESTGFIGSLFALTIGLAGFNPVDCQRLSGGRSWLVYARDKFDTKANLWKHVEAPKLNEKTIAF